MGDEMRRIVDGSQLRVAGNAPDGGERLAGVFGEGVYERVAITAAGVLDGDEPVVWRCLQYGRGIGAGRPKVVEGGVRSLRAIERTW